MYFFLKVAIVCSFFFAPQLKASNFIERWFFSDKAYAKQIEVKTYILTDSQASALLADPSKEPVPLIGKELSKFPKRYLAARVRNLGELHACGTLVCSVPGIWDPIKIPITRIDDDFCDYLICVEGASVTCSHETFAPKVTFEWDQLYTCCR